MKTFSNSIFSNCDDDLKERLANEQMKIVYRHLPGVTILPVFAAAVLAFLMQDKVPFARAWGWVIWVACVYFTLPLIWYFWYQKSSNRFFNASMWAKRYIILSLITAASWGACGVLLYVPNELFYQLFMAGMLCTAAASIMVATFSYPPGYFAGILPLLAPLTIMLFLEGQLIHYIFVGIMLMFFMMLTFFQQNMYKGFKEMIYLRFDRDNLVDELEAKNGLINAAIQKKSQFLAAASHDLKQPMQAQQLFLSELSARTNDKDTQQIITQMKSSMGSMDVLLDDLMTVSKLESGVIEFERTTFFLKPILQRLEKQFHMAVMEKGLRFRISKCAHAVYSDPVMLERILRNFVQNAVRYTKSGAILVACRCIHDQLEIQVRDSGPGVLPKDQARIFDGFIQLDNSGNKTGNGLGLAIVKQLSKLLGHDVGVRSRTGEGSTFFVRVPLRHDELFTPQLTQSQFETDILADARILVTDDDHSILSAVGLLLDRWRCDYVLASDFEQAFSSVDEDEFIPHVLIADYHLQGDTNGIQLINKLRALTNSVLPAVLITSDMSPDIIRAAHSHNCILMHKPVDSVSLYNLLCNLYRVHSENTSSSA